MRIEPQWVSSDKRSPRVYFLEDDILYAIPKSQYM